VKSLQVYLHLGFVSPLDLHQHLVFLSDFEIFSFTTGYDACIEFLFCSSGPIGYLPARNL